MEPIMEPAPGYMLIVECTDPLAGNTFEGSKLVIPDEAFMAMPLTTALVLVSKSKVYGEKTIVWFKKMQEEGLLVSGVRHAILHEAQVRASVPWEQYPFVQAKSLSAADIKQLIDAENGRRKLER